MRLAAFCVVAFFASVPASFAEGPTFDVASVKLFNPELKPPWVVTGGPGTSDPSRFRVPRIGMALLLARAFNVSADQIAGPAWLRDVSDNNYTVIATMPPDTTKEQFQKMLQNLLAERFHLVFHRDTRNFPGYALVVDKGGPNFKEVTPAPAADSDAARDPRPMTIGADGFPDLPGPRTLSQIRGGDVRAKYQERTMSEVVSDLGFPIGASLGKSWIDGYPQPRVIDKTGLTEKYTLFLEYYSEANAALARQFPGRADSDAANGSPPAPSDPGGGGPNIFAAIQKQLGLRLDKTADVPLDIIVVESVDKVPTAD